MSKEPQRNEKEMSFAPDVQVEVVSDAWHQYELEHKMPLRQALRQYKKALFWSAVFGMTLVMQAYDTNLATSFYALPSFQKRFGFRVGKTENYQLTPAWQSSISEAGTTGMIIGMMSNAWLVDRFGNRRITWVCLVVITLCIFILFFAQNLPMLLAGEFLINIPLGSVNTIAPGYAVEVVPLRLRHYGPTFVHLCVVLGHLFSSGILNIWVGNTTEWAWRLPFAIQWVWPLPLLSLLIFAPESPWWLVRHGRHDEAMRSLEKLSTRDVDNTRALAFIQHTVELERSSVFGRSIWDCFRGTDARRTWLAIGSFFAQAMCGFCLPGGPYFFEVAGLPTKYAFYLNIGQYAMGSISTILSFWVMQKFSRRFTLFLGCWGQGLAECLIGILALLPHQTPAVVWPQGVMVLVRFFFFGISLGPLAYVTGSEISSFELRQKTLSLGISTFFIVTLVGNVVAPYLLNPTAANLKGKAAWISGGCNFAILIWGYFYLPETKDRSIEELDVMFAKRVPAKQFSKYRVTTEEMYGAAVDKIDGVDVAKE